MQKWILIPDSFKGTLSSAEICKILSAKIRQYAPWVQPCCIPVADGGEGTVDAFLTAVGGERRTVQVEGPYRTPVDACYGVLPDGTAVIEMAAAAGLPLAGPHPCVEKASTYGVGQLMRHAVTHGCRRILLGLGGSATNDGGCGAAAALGAVFRKADGSAFVPTGQTLSEIASVELTACRTLLKKAPVSMLCDIQNPLCGPKGAAAVFGPQKGANAEQIRMLDRGLSHLADCLQKTTGLEIRDLPGAGAAGGMGGGMAAFVNGRLQSGIETLLETVKFSEMLQDTALVITGEGKLDQQSLFGKVLSGVARRTKAAGVMLLALVGDIDDHAVEQAYAAGLTAVFSTNRMALPFSKAKERAKSDFSHAAEDLVRLLAACSAHS